MDATYVGLTIRLSLALALGKAAIGLACGTGMYMAA